MGLSKPRQLPPAPEQRFGHEALAREPHLQGTRALGYRYRFVLVPLRHDSSFRIFRRVRTPGWVKDHPPDQDPQGLDCADHLTRRMMAVGEDLTHLPGRRVR